MTTPALLNASLNPGTALIDLYTLDATFLPNVGELFRFTNHIGENGDSFVQFQGHTYLPVPCKGDGYFESTSGLAPRPKFTVTDHSNAVSSVLGDNDMGGAKLTRLRVYAANLDNGTHPADYVASTSTFMVENLLEARWGETITWQLCAPHDIPNLMVPRQRFIRAKFPGIGRSNLR